MKTTELLIQFWHTLNLLEDFTKRINLNHCLVGADLRSLGIQANAKVDKLNYSWSIKGLI